MATERSLLHNKTRLFFTRRTLQLLFASSMLESLPDWRFSAAIPITPGSTKVMYIMVFRSTFLESSFCYGGDHDGRFGAQSFGSGGSITEQNQRG